MVHQQSRDPRALIKSRKNATSREMILGIKIKTKIIENSFFTNDMTRIRMQQHYFSTRLPSASIMASTLTPTIFAISAQRTLARNRSATRSLLASWANAEDPLAQDISREMKDWTQLNVLVPKTHWKSEIFSNQRRISAGISYFFCARKGF